MLSVCDMTTGSNRRGSPRLSKRVHRSLKGMESESIDVLNSETEDIGGKGVPLVVEALRMKKSGGFKDHLRGTLLVFQLDHLAMSGLRFVPACPQKLKQVSPSMELPTAVAHALTSAGTDSTLSMPIESHRRGIKFRGRIPHSARVSNDAAQLNREIRTR